MVKQFKKKRHVGLIVFLSLITVFLVIPIGFFFIFIFDVRTVDLSGIDKNFNTDQVVATAVVDSISDTKNTHAVSIDVDSNKLNSVMYQLHNKFAPEGSQANNYIPKMYCVINENNYDFYVDLQASFLKTRVCLATTINTVDADDPYMEFKVNQIRLGRFSANFLYNLLLKFGAQFLSNEKLQDAFKQFGLNVVFDLNNRNFKYYRSQYKIDVKNILTTKFSGGNNMFTTIISELIDKDDPDIVSFSFKDKMSFKINLEKLHENTEYTPISGAMMDLNLDKYSGQIKTLLDKNIIASGDAKNMFTYLLRGWEGVNETIKSLVRGKDLTSINITNNETYTGYNFGVSEEDKDITAKKVTETKNILDNIDPVNPPPKGYLFKLTSEELNSYIKTLDIIGTTSFLIRQENDNSYKVNYITVDNFNFKFVNNGLQAFMRLNINGYYVTFILSTLIPASSQGSIEKLTFEIGDIFLGQIDANKNANLRTQVIKILKDNLKSVNSIFNVNETTGNIELDISKVLNDSQISTKMGILLNYATVKSEVTQTGGLSIIAEKK